MIVDFLITLVVGILSAPLHLLPTGHLSLPNVGPVIAEINAWDSVFPVHAVLVVLIAYSAFFAVLFGVRVVVYIYRLIPAKFT